MPKYTDESAKGAAFAASMKRPEKLYGNDGPASTKGQKVDPSVQLGPLQGEPRCCVNVNSPAYTGKFPGYAK